ncbi:Hypothetical predicted protein [Paramuricea clavata]|uniref:Uncharacterized protein n=1 Tax=Paramuricea clavata TaxID=317549 RepID=A0A6S7GZM1_PARCT|nr:Hypothetical predicted protein [Paramuricea clavata]
MADPEGEIEDDARLLEGDEATHAQESPSGDRHESQSNMEEKFEELLGNIKDGFSSLGELLTDLMQQKSRGKRSRQKSRSSSPDSADGDQTTDPKRARLEDEQNDDVAVLLGDVVQELDEEQLGPDVSEKLAQVINKTLRSKLSEGKLKEKSRDIRLQKVQSLLLKGLLPLVQLLENCRQSDDTSTDKGKIIKLVLDSVSLVAQANIELNNRQRALIKPDLNEKFQQICGDHVPITTLLFGDDVAKTLQDIASTNRVSQKVATPTRRPSYAHQNNFNRHSKNGRGEVQAPKQPPTLQKGPKPLQTTESVKLDKQSPKKLTVSSSEECIVDNEITKLLMKEDVTVSLTSERATKLKTACINLLAKRRPLIQEPVNKSFAKDPGGISRGYTDNTPVAYTTMVPCGNANVGQPPTDFAQNATSTLLTSQSGQDAPTTSETQTIGMSLLWKSLQSQGISNQAAHIIIIIIKSWRSGTVQQYQTYLKKWALFCCERQVNPISPSLTDILDLFTVLFDEGVQYSGLITARSALSAII